ncbi:MAG: FHA domain-containing protein [Gammaproteobacteria bacterium]|nr:FHA domain-containing protein [Gammaproteobacteria bacterium]
MTTIIVTHENNEVEEHDFEPEIRTITIGRRSTNDVCISNLSVSGTHAKIMLSDSGSMVEDLNSTNGTYINGRLISRQLLNDGDDIVMGRVRVTFIAAADKPDLQSGITDDDAQMLDDPLTLTEKPETVALDAAEPSPAETPVTNRGSDSDDSAAGLSSAFDDDMPVLTPTRDHTRPQVAPATERLVTAQDAVASSDTGIVHELDNASTSSAVIEIKNGAKSGQVLPIDKPVTTLGRPGIQIAAIMKKPDGYFLMHIESDDEVAPPQLNNSSIGDEPVLLQSGDALNVAGIDVQFMLS